MHKPVSAIIVDDEREAIDYLSILLKENFPEISIIATAVNSSDAEMQVFKKRPDLLFLDIKIDSKNGFDIIEELNNENYFPHVIFVTAYDNFAIEAFKANAIDYLLKPVDPGDLVRAVKKFFEKRQLEQEPQNILGLLNNYNPRIQFNTRTGYILINPFDIVYCKSDGNYSEIYLKDNTKKLVSYNLKNLLEQLPQPPFKRISRFHIINERYLVEVNKGIHSCKLMAADLQVFLNYSPKVFS